jgi:NDP-sugar pyrophosphorylase family protein
MERSSLPFTAMILAGGLGTRLRPVVSDRPKPLAAVCGVPFLEILVSLLARKGVRDFVLLTGYMGEMIENHFRGRFGSQITVRFAREDKPLGTGGAVRHAADFATDPTLLVNGDTYLDGDLQALLRVHLEKGADVTLSLVRVEDVSAYGSVNVGAGGRVTGFSEKSPDLRGPGLINGGVSLLSRDFIRSLPPMESFSMERGVFPAAALSGKMYGIVQQGAFFDIGTPESYEAFKRFAADAAHGPVPG